MDGFTNHLGGDQFSADMLNVKYDPHFTPTISAPQVGYYEDALRMQQLGLNANMVGANPNPYLQDSIKDSPRHNLIRPHSLDTRSMFLAGHAHEPGLIGVNRYSSDGQSSLKYPSERAIDLEREHRMDRMGCKKKMTAGQKLDKMLENTPQQMLMMVFIFIILLFVVIMHGRLRQEIKGGVDHLRDLIVNQSS